MVINIYLLSALEKYVRASESEAIMKHKLAVRPSLKSGMPYSFSQFLWSFESLEKHSGTDYLMCP
jgi:hypothetical protein